MRWGVLLLVLGGLLVPAASATPVTGEIQVQSMGFDAEATGETLLRAAYAEDTEAIQLLRVEAREVKVYRWEIHAVEARPATGTLVTTEFVQASYSLTDVVLTLAQGDHAGWAGVRGGSLSTSHVTLDAGVARFAGSDALGFLNPSSPAEDPNAPHFYEASRGPVIRLDGVSSLSLSGEASLRMAGPDVLIQSAQNTTTLRTGWQRDDGPVGRTTVTWITIEAVNATLRIEGATLGAQASRAELAWDGRARLVGAEGTLSAREQAWTLHDAGTISGRLEAALAPGEEALWSAVHGDLTATSYPASTRIPAPAIGTTAPWLWVLLGLALGSGGVWLVHARRAQRNQPTIEQLHDLISQALESGRYVEALEWLDVARRRVPTSLRLRHDEIFALSELGRVEEALALARETADTDAESAWQVARLLARKGAHPRDVAPWTIRALDLDPLTLMEIHEDPLLEEARELPDVRAKIAEAERRLE